MVILIGAESCTGKTVMAQKLLETYKIPYLSLDHLKMGLYKANYNCSFTPEDSNEIIEERLWPIIKGIITTNIENKQNIIIEGCYLFPSRLKEFDENYSKHIIPIFMGFSKNYIEKNFLSGIIKHRCQIEDRRYDEDRPISQFISENMRLKTLCKENSVNYFEIDRDYKKDTSKVYQWIDCEMSKHNNYLLTNMTHL